MTSKIRQEKSVPSTVYIAHMSTLYIVQKLVLAFNVTLKLFPLRINSNWIDNVSANEI